jgi:hypothetical protein
MNHLFSLKAKLTYSCNKFSHLFSFIKVFQFKVKFFLDQVMNLLQVLEDLKFVVI